MISGGITAELHNFVGIRVLSCVQFDCRDDGISGECNCVDFVLNGFPFTAYEGSVFDEFGESGVQRSCCDMVRIFDDGFIPKNTFAPVEVSCVMREPIEKCNILDMVDVITGKCVLSIGTDEILYFSHEAKHRGFYPIFIAQFHPENMHINAKVL
jgi:hypothetical protein